MKKYRLKFDVDLCQGQFVCTAADPDHFRQANERKAELAGGEKEGNIETLDISEEELADAKTAAGGCAFQAINLIDKQSGEVIAPSQE